jgi:Protein of unknown function (DUF3606)
MSVHRQTGPKDPNQVSMNDPEELRWWCQVLGVTEDKLREAVREVGSDAHKVREYVRK